MLRPLSTQPGKFGCNQAPTRTPGRTPAHALKRADSPSSAGLAVGRDRQRAGTAHRGAGCAQRRSASAAPAGKEPLSAAAPPSRPAPPPRKRTAQARRRRRRGSRDAPPPRLFPGGTLGASRALGGRGECPRGAPASRTGRAWAGTPPAELLAGPTGTQWRRGTPFPPPLIRACGWRGRGRGWGREAGGRGGPGGPRGACGPGGRAAGPGGLRG